MSRRRAAWLYVGLGSPALLLALLVGCPVYLRSRWIAQYEEAAARARAEGAVLDPAAFAPPPVPDEENAAVLYRQAFDALELRLLKVISEIGEADLELCEPAFELLRKAGERPRCRWDLDWGAGLDMGVPHIDGTLLAFKALVAAARIEPGAEPLLRLLELSRSLRGDPFMLPQMMRCQIIGSAFDVFDPDRLDLSAVDWRRLGALCDDPGLREILARSLEFERAATHQAIRGWIDGRSAALMYPMPNPIEKLGMLRSASDWLERIGRLIPAIRRPYHEGHAEIEAIVSEVNRSQVSHMLAALMLSGVEDWSRTAAEAEAKLRIMAVVCALKADPEAPVDAIDPFTGKPLDVDREGDTVRVSCGDFRK